MEKTIKVGELKALLENLNEELVIKIVKDYSCNTPVLELVEELLPEKKTYYKLSYNHDS